MGNGEHDASGVPQGGGAEPSAQHNSAAAGAGVVVGGGSGRGELPEEVEEVIFIALQKDPRYPAAVRDARLVCMEWKRWVAVRMYLSPRPLHLPQRMFKRDISNQA